jgi:hypothetical protein
MLTLLALLTACHPDAAKPEGDTSAVSDTGPAADTDSGLPTDTDADADGYTSTDDCDDADAAVHPDAAETCDGVDQDCDGLVDEDFATFSAAPDLDGDGFGDAAGIVAVCALPDGWVLDATDCDDADVAVFPGQLETCNGYDDDCDGLVDDADSPLAGAVTWYADADGDGYGDEDERVTRCDGGEGYVAGADDCDDTDATINPSATEVCLDLVDQDCDGYSDDYTGDCGTLTDPGDVDLCDPSAVPVDASLCTAGVAAVLPSGATYTTVQDAIDDATAGDIVTVCAGTWTEDLTQTVSPLTLVGYGSGTSTLAAARGSVIDMGNGHELTLVDLSIEGGGGESGGGVHGGDATVCVARSSFALNTVTLGGGAMYLSGFGTVSIEDTEFYGNSSDSSGGAVAFQTYTVTIEDSTFLSNQSGYDGGAATIDSTSTVAISSTEFTSNRADYTGGALKYGGWGPALTMSLTDVTFTSNTTDYEGGAITLGDWDYPVVTCVSCTFDSNSTSYEGGAITMNSWGGGTFNAVFSTFTNNSSRSGGAVDLHAWGSPDANFEACVFDGNTGESGGALHIDPVGSASTMYVTMTDSTVTNNSATSCGGGAFVDSAATATLEVTNSDWGSGGTDNGPDDVCGYSAYGAASTFTCTLGSCF